MSELTSKLKVGLLWGYEWLVYSLILSMELTGFEEIVSGTPIVTWNVFGLRNKASVDPALKRTLRNPENKPNMANKANMAHAARGAAHSVARSA